MIPTNLKESASYDCGAKYADSMESITYQYSCNNAVAEWNRARFRRYWTRISSTRYPGRLRLAAEIRRLVRTMAQDGWGAPRIHAELTKLGFIVSEVTVSRYMPRRPAEPDQVKRWVAF